MSGESGYTKSSKGDSTQTVHGNRFWLVEGMASDTVLGMNSQTVVGLNSLAVAGLQQGLFVVGVQTVVLGGIDNMVWGWASDYASSWTEEHPVHVEKHGTRTVSVEGASTEEVVGVASIMAGEMNLSAESELAMTADTITRSGATLISDTTEGAYSNVAGASVIGADESMSLIGGGSNLQLVPGTAQINAPTVFINGELINLGQPPVLEDIAPVDELPEVVVSNPGAPVGPEEETGDDPADGAKNETPEDKNKNLRDEQDTTVGEERGGEDAQTTAEDNPGSGAGGEEISIDLTDGSFHDDDDSLDSSSSDAATNRDSISTIATDDSGGTDSLEVEDDVDDLQSTVAEKDESEAPDDLDGDDREQLTQTRLKDGKIKENWIDKDGNPRQRILDAKGMPYKPTRWEQLGKLTPSVCDIALRCLQFGVGLLENA